GHMADDDLGALCRFQAVVRILAQLVLDEMLRGGGLSDVMIERSDTRQKCVAAYNPAGFFGKLSDRVRMLIGTRSAKRKLAERRQVGIGKLKEFDIGENAEDSLAYRHKNRRRRRGYYPARKP